VTSKRGRLRQPLSHGLVHELHFVIPQAQGRGRRHADPAHHDAGFRFTVVALGLLPTLAFSDHHR